MSVDQQPVSTFDEMAEPHPPSDDASLGSTTTKPVVMSEGERVCSTCGALRESAWAFGGSCGSDLDQLRDEVDPSSSVDIEPRRRRRKQVAASAAVVLLVLGLGAAGGTGWVKLEHREEQLAATRGTLDTTQAQLAFANDTLDTAREQLETTEGDLNDSEDQVQELQSNLEEAEGSLNHAQDRLDLQAGQIDTLQSCLSGVTRALSDLAAGYVALALSDLQAVESDCTEAGSIL